MTDKTSLEEFFTGEKEDKPFTRRRTFKKKKRKTLYERPKLVGWKEECANHMEHICVECERKFYRNGRYVYNTEKGYVCYSCGHNMTKGTLEQIFPKSERKDTENKNLDKFFGGETK